MNYEILKDLNNYKIKKLIKVNKKYTNNNLIYLEKNTYKKIKILFKDIKKRFHYNLVLTDGYKTSIIIEYEKLSKLFNTGNAFNISNNIIINNYILNNLSKYGLIKEDNFYCYVGKDAYFINRYHLKLFDYLKMFK